jgi:hypothetical protein
MITIVRDSGGEWIAVYKDGKLLIQGHSIQEEDLLRILEIDLRWMEQNLGDENHPYWCRHLPHDLNELLTGHEQTGT